MLFCRKQNEILPQTSHRNIDPLRGDRDIHSRPALFSFALKKRKARDLRCRFVFPDLFGGCHEIHAIGIQCDRAFVPKHVCESAEFFRRRKELMHRVFRLELVIEVELFLGNAVSQPIILNSQPRHNVLRLLPCGRTSKHHRLTLFSNRDRAITVVLGQQETRLPQGGAF